MGLDGLVQAMNGSATTSSSGRRPTRRGWPATAAVVALALLVAGCGSDGSDAADPGAAPAGTLEGLVRPEPLEVGELTLPEVASDGTTTPFAFTAPEGELLFVAFGYTNCPDVCPTTLFDIKKALSELGDDADRVGVAFATVDPTRDTPDVMAQYLESFVVGGHPLRTDDPDELRAVEDGFGVTSQVVENPDGSTDVAHTARSFVVDDQGRVVVEWAFGTGYEVMAGDLSILLDQRAS